jgi:acyl carrier protein
MKNKKKKILGIIQPIFQEVLKNKKLKLKYESSPETIKNWDSISTVAIVVDLEKSLKIKFNVSELANLKNVGEIIDTIIKKKMTKSLTKLLFKK